MLDLKKLLDGSVSSLDFSLVLSDNAVFDEGAEGSAKAEGVITNHAGSVVLEGRLTPELTVECARCGKKFNYSEAIMLNAKIAEELANEDEEEFILLEDGCFDEEEFIRSSLILELPSRFLCSDDCKGLCPKCGCDLNKKDCGCDLKDRDSRWDVLKDYFGE